MDFLDVVKRKRALMEGNPEMMAMLGELSTEAQKISPHVGKNLRNI